MLLYFCGLDPCVGYIELNNFLKALRLASTGGQAKLWIRSGAVKVNGAVETRNKKKLAPGDAVEFEGKTYAVTDELAKQRE